MVVPRNALSGYPAAPRPPALDRFRTDTRRRPDHADHSSAAHANAKAESHPMASENPGKAPPSTPKSPAPLAEPGDDPLGIQIAGGSMTARFRD